LRTLVKKLSTVNTLNFLKNIFAYSYKKNCQLSTLSTLRIKPVEIEAKAKPLYLFVRLDTDRTFSVVSMAIFAPYA
jgi:hypothetical protein